MKGKFFLLFMIFVLQPGIPSLGQADTVYRFSLQEALDHAVAHNLTIRNATEDVKVAEMQIKQYLASGFPQINANVNYNDNLHLQTTLIPDFFSGNPDKKVEVQFGSQHNASAAISAQQMIFNGPFLVGLEAMKVLRKLNQQNLEKTEKDVKETVAQTYYIILAGQETVRILKENFQNMQKSLSETEKLYKAGFVEDISVDQLRVSVTSLKNAVLSARRQEEASMRLLKFQMGLDLEAQIELTDNLDNMLREIDYQNIILQPFRLADQIDFQVIDTQAKLAELNLKKEKYNYFPTVSALYNNQWSAIRDKFDFFDPTEKWFYASFLGITVNIPVFSSGLRKATVGMRKVELEKALISRKLVEQNLLMENQQVRENLATAWENFISQKENVALSKKVVEKTSIKVKAGTASSLDLTQVNNQYLQTQTSYFSALIQLINAKIQLDKLLNRI
ncbi:MAG: TolC family protein [Chlorobi bacterium]|nr:TolC family protein [Chlorobiota bacterium]